MNLTVLGAGLIGVPMIIDMAEDRNFKIKAADINEEVFKKLESFPVETIITDLSEEENVKSVIGESDFVINAVPGYLGFQTLRWVIESGKNVVDIAFYENDPFELDAIAKSNNVTAIVDCGVTPGLSNLLIGSIQNELDKIDSIKILVGGLPELKEPPFEYKAVFSPTDVLEEYIRPARMIVNGKEIEMPAMTDIELIHFDEAGELEAFNSDGLRTLLKTVKAENMVEKTLRYPGHAEKIKLLKKIGLLEKEKVQVSGCYVSPLELTAEMLKPLWKLSENDRDFTVMRTNVLGRKDGNLIEYKFDLFDRYDASSGTISMARTTGYTATSAVRMLAEDLYSCKGVSPPEYIGKHPACTDFILNELEKRGIIVKKEIKNKDFDALN